MYVNSCLAYYWGRVSIMQTSASRRTSHTFEDKNIVTYLPKAKGYK